MAAGLGNITPPPVEMEQASTGPRILHMVPSLYFKATYKPHNAFILTFYDIIFDI